jgi:phosphoribosylformimino-5-aminoimidazole carboxamide ribotide isomerase
MLILPAIDLKEGRCVRLLRGDFTAVTVFGDDPAAMARRWRAEGAAMLHVVDLDGAAQGQLVNQAALEGILATGAAVQFGGGVRSLATIERLLDLGVQRVVLGTAAVADPALLDAALTRWPERIAIGIDARGGMVAIRGWRETTAVAATDLARDVARRGARTIIYTDVERDGTLTAPNVAALAAVRQAAGVDVIASGGIARLEHLLELKRRGAAGAIVGRALYTGVIALPEALRALAALDDAPGDRNG